MSRNFLCGLLGGTWATVMNNPFDVVVSRIRNVLPGETTPYRHALQSLFRVASMKVLHCIKDLLQKL